MSKEHPIIFSGPMVKAILEGRKTQTRRVIKPQPFAGVNYGRLGKDGILHMYEVKPSGRVAVWDDIDRRCRYGQPGDMLWVRESFYIQGWLGLPLTAKQPIHYAASTDRAEVEDYQLRPAIHMPKWACRLWLEVTSIRAARVQDITEDDARAEGITTEIVVNPHFTLSWTAKSGFIAVWNSINAKRGYPWEDNPWVWVVTFKYNESTSSQHPVTGLA